MVIFRRVLISLGCVLLLVLLALYFTLYNITHGPSETMRNELVIMAKQASATKWLPGLFLSKSEVESIVAAGDTAVALDLSELVLPEIKQTPKPAVSPAPGEATPEPEPEPEPDPWENAIDGMIYETYMGQTYKAYILLVRDPSRVYLAKGSKNFGSESAGSDVFAAVKREDALAAINGGAFRDVGGQGNGGQPIGLTYSNGECVWDDGVKSTFIGITNDNRLVVENTMTRAQADELGMRDGCSFLNDKVLVNTDANGNLSAYYTEDEARAQRTAIGQCEDGTIILIVTDGRSASSIGASGNDIVDLMLSYGAVNAGMLDGGSSTVMYYEDYAEKYGIDKSNLDYYQKLGLTNRYRAFTSPRRVATFFMVKK